MAVAALWAAPAPDLAAQAKTLEKQIQAGDWQHAADTARALESAVAQKAPLEIVDLEVMTDAPDALGIYTVPFHNEIRGDSLYVYAQVRNHGIEERAGFYYLHLVSDLVVLDAKGHELARDEALGESYFGARAPHRDTLVVIALRTKGLAPGEYRLRLILHDRIAKKEASREVTFRIPKP